MASRWTLDPRSCLTSFFLNLTSHIPWLVSSCNDQNPNRNTASASHSGASPTRSSAADDSNYVVIDIDAGAICTLNAHGTRSTTIVRSSQTKTFDSSRSGPVHLIAKMFQGQELGKALLAFDVTMTMGLLIDQHPGLTQLHASTVVLVLSVGFVTLWSGMLLHDIHRGVASALEYIGVGTILVAYFGLVSSFLLPSLVWAGWLCCGLSCLPFLLRLVLRRREEASTTERLDPGSMNQQQFTWISGAGTQSE